MTHTRENFDHHIALALEWCIHVDVPLKLMASYATDNGHGVLMYGYFGAWPQQIIHTVRTDFNIGRGIFTTSDRCREYLLDNNMLVYDGDPTRSRINDQWIVIPWGKYQHFYQYHGTEEAVLLCLRHGGMLFEKSPVEIDPLHQS